MLDALLRTITGSTGTIPVVRGEIEITAAGGREIIEQSDFPETITAQALARFDRRVAGGQRASEALTPVMAWAAEQAEDHES